MHDVPLAPLRQRQRAELRHRIIGVANELFREHGYDAVTLEDIADACVISKRTITRHFTSKEALALAQEYDLLEMFRSALQNRQGDAVTCWREFNIETTALIAAPEARRRMRDILAHPGLFAEFLRVSDSYQTELAHAIDDDTDNTDKLRSQLYASLLAWGTGATFRQWVASDEPFNLERLQAIIDRAVTIFDDPAERSMRRGQPGQVSSGSSGRRTASSRQGRKPTKG